MSQIQIQDAEIGVDDHLLRGRVGRRARAKMRIALASTQSPQQQLRRLDQRLGKGTGAQRERDRLSLIYNDRSRS
jgi:hypothetical protein